MKIDRLIVAAAFVLAVAISPALAQTRPAAPTTTPQTGAPAGNLPQSKIALIYSDAFLDAKTGIGRFNTLITTLNREFQPRQTELQGMQQRIQTMTTEVSTAQDRKSTRLNSSHGYTSYAVFCLK